MIARFIRSLLATFGLLDLAQRRRQAGRIRAILKKYPHASLTVVVDDKRIVIPTPTWYTKHWYFTRCADGRPHEPSVTRLLMQAARKAACFVDIGAHVGYFTVVAAQVMDPVNVYSFEMDPFHMNELSTVVSNLSDADGIHVVHAAVSDTPGTMNVANRIEGHPGIGIHDHATRDATGSDTTSIPVVTLSSYFDQLGITPDLYKIDVEGAEHLVLNGMGRQMGLDQATIFLEVHPSKIEQYGSSIRDVMTRIDALGFRAREIRGLRSAAIDTDLVDVTDASSLTENTMLLLTPRN